MRGAQFVFGTVWAYAKLREVGMRKNARIDWWDNITFAVGPVSVLIGLTYGLMPHGGQAMGWAAVPACSGSHPRLLVQKLVRCSPISVLVVRHLDVTITKSWRCTRAHHDAHRFEHRVLTPSAADVA
jgi:hypothetical protein